MAQAPGREPPRQPAEKPAKEPERPVKPYPVDDPPEPLGPGSEPDYIPPTPSEPPMKM